MTDSAAVLSPETSKPKDQPKKPAPQPKPAQEDKGERREHWTQKIVKK